MPRWLTVPILLSLLLALACDRNVEPFDASEEPKEPDLSKIFPPGAEQAAQRVVPELPEAPGRGAPPLAQETGAAGAPITGTIRRAPGFDAPIPDGAVLFLIARRGGGGPPLAVKRVQDPSLPMEFSIGPDDRMIQAMPFEGPLLLTARVDGDGDAMSREPGDLVGAASESHEPGASGVVVEIGERL